MRKRPDAKRIAQGRPPSELRAARSIIRCFGQLARSGEHLLDCILAGQVPVAWEHYPTDDAVDRRGLYQWYYHSHAASDRPDSIEHGHVHLFAREDHLRRAIRPGIEQAFLRRLGAGSRTGKTRHLIGIGLDAKGVPCSLFTVNSWVTGDLLLSAGATAQLLRRLRLDTGHPLIDKVLMATIALHLELVDRLLRERDATLSGIDRSEGDLLQSMSREVLSSADLDIDARLADVLA